jgi:serine/threonine protein kinase
VNTGLEVPPRRRLLVPSFTLKLGERIGEDLTIIGHLHRGRNSELYQVWSLSYLCALTCKILLPGFAPRSGEGRSFRTEAMLLERMKHPQIVRIFQRGNFEGRDYLIQEFLNGPSLLDILERAPDRRFTIPDAIKTIVHVGSALDHLHSQGFVYQDLKPANILFRGGIPVLVDFDSAVRPKAGQKWDLIPGTDPYMAPEQCHQGEIYASTDVYGLGAMFYELLTGQWPFEEELRQKREKKVLEDRYPQVRGTSPKPPHEFIPGISEELSRIVLRCLEMDPSARFPSVRDLIKNLVPFLEGKDRMWPESVDLSCCSR